jgi:hypothetical protein
MHPHRPRLRWLLLGLLLSCRAITEPSHGSVRPARPPTVDTPAPPALYAADEALRDALSGPLHHLGTGRWPGVRRSYACAFRNERVIVVDVYCSPTEKQAFRLSVYSPTRGRVSIYAEAKGTLSKLRREDYFTFTAETEPASPKAQLTLGLSFDALRAYEQQRYDAFLPSCFGGTELSRPRSGCLAALAPRSAEWSRRNAAFLSRANDDWYRLVGDMRLLAAHHGREPD